MSIWDQINDLLLEGYHAKKPDLWIGSKIQVSLETWISRPYNFSILEYIKLIKKKCFVFVSKRPFRGEKLHNGNYFVVAWQFIFYYSNLCNIKDHFCIYLPSTYVLIHNMNIIFESSNFLVRWGVMMLYMHWWRNNKSLKKNIFESSNFLVYWRRVGVDARKLIQIITWFTSKNTKPNIRKISKYNKIRLFRGWLKFFAQTVIVVNRRHVITHASIYFDVGNIWQTLLSSSIYF